MDERGMDLTSEKLAALVAEAGDSGHNGIVFAIGGGGWWLIPSLLFVA